MNSKKTIQSFLELPVQPSSEWHGGKFAFAQLLGEQLDPDSLSKSEASDASMSLWVALDNGMVHSEPDTQLEPLELMIQSMVKFVQVQGVSHRPARIGLTNSELVEPMKKLLEGSGTEVNHEPVSEFWNEVKSDLTRHFSESVGEGGSAPSIAESDLTDEQITEFAVAAAEFYRTGIWQHLNDADLLKVTTPRPPKHLKYAMVLGNGRLEYGLGFYDSPDVHWDMRSGRLDLRSVEVFNLTFISTAEVCDSDVVLWEELELPLESGKPSHCSCILRLRVLAFLPESNLNTWRCCSKHWLPRRKMTLIPASGRNPFLVSAKRRIARSRSRISLIRPTEKHGSQGE